MFTKFKFDVWNLVMDHYVTYWCWPFERCNLCKSFKRTKLLELVHDKFKKELDLVLMLKKIRDSHDILKHMHKKDDRQLLKFNKDRVVCLEEEEEKELREQEPATNKSNSNPSAPKDEPEVDSSQVSESKKNESSISESEEEEIEGEESKEKEKLNTIRAEIKKSIIKGMNLDKASRK